MRCADMWDGLEDTRIGRSCPRPEIGSEAWSRLQVELSRGLEEIDGRPVAMHGSGLPGPGHDEAG